MAVALAACSAGGIETATSSLSRDDKAIHQILSLELADFIEGGYQADGGMCVAMQRVPNAGIDAVPPAVMEALEKQAGKAVHLIPYSKNECPFDDWSKTIKGRVLLSASKVIRTNDTEPDWLAGVAFETLYGWGHAYAIEIVGDDIKVRSLGMWIS
jgi:hypothetical protein